MLIVIPLSFLRRLDSLKYTSIVALISISYLVVLVVYHFCEGDTKADRGPIRVIEWGGLVPTSWCLRIRAIKTYVSLLDIIRHFLTLIQMFSILNEIKDNSPRR
jgi:amino acid permease